MTRLAFQDDDRNMSLLVNEKAIQRYSFIEDNDKKRCKRCEFQSMCFGGYTNPIKCFFHLREDGLNGYWIEKE